MKTTQQSARIWVLGFAIFLVIGLGNAMWPVLTGQSLMQWAEQTVHDAETREALVRQHVTGNRAHEALLLLDMEQRAAEFQKILANENCGQVTFTYDQGFDTKSGDGFWNARCRTGKEYLVRVKPTASGHTSILDCAVVRAVSKLECFEKLADQSRRFLEIR
jgi:hypothetical protein